MSQLFYKAENIPALIEFSKFYTANVDYEEYREVLSHAYKISKKEKNFSSLIQVAEAFGEFFRSKKPLPRKMESYRSLLDVIDTAQQRLVDDMSSANPQYIASEYLILANLCYKYEIFKQWIRVLKVGLENSSTEKELRRIFPHTILNNMDLLNKALEYLKKLKENSYVIRGSTFSNAPWIIEQLENKKKELEKS